MPMMVADFHTHILPGIDDGSSCVEESLAMLQMEKEQGIDTVVVTPHFYPQEDRPERFLKRRKEAFELLSSKISADDKLPHIIQGAEVYYFKGIGQWDGLKDLAIENTNYLLLEMPMTKWDSRMYDDIYDIYRSQGLIPVIAHLDRYINIFNVKGVLDNLGELPVVVQANASFFLDKSSRRLALKLLKNNVINIIGSDCHNIGTRKPNLGAAVEVIQQQLGAEYIDRIKLTEKKILSDLINI